MTGPPRNHCCCGSMGQTAWSLAFTSASSCRQTQELWEIPPHKSPNPVPDAVLLNVQVLMAITLVGRKISSIASSLSPFCSLGSNSLAPLYSETNYPQPD